MPRVVAFAPLHRLDFGKGEARQDRNPVIALLADLGDVRITEALQLLEREAVVRTLRLLQTQDVRRDQIDGPFDLLDPEANGIDIPGGDAEAQEGLQSANAVPPSSLAGG